MADNEQTLHGLATWLVSMDEPGSTARSTVTLTKITEAAREALANEEAQHDALYLAVQEEVERLRDEAAENRDFGTRCKTVEVGNQYLQAGREIDERADRLQEILDRAGEKREVPDYRIAFDDLSRVVSHVVTKLMGDPRNQEPEAVAKYLTQAQERIAASLSSEQKGGGS